MSTIGHLNHRGGWALVQSTWTSWLQYRSFFFLLAFGWMIPPLIYLFVWSTAAGEGSVGGMTRGEFVGYYLILILVNQITYAQTNWTVGDIIRSGGLSTWLLRPMPPLYHVLSSEVAGKVVYMAFVVPVAAILAWLLRPELHPTPGGAPLFVVALGLAWALRFFWGLWIALLAFWATRADSLLAVQDSLVFLLAGVVAPVSLLPELLQTASLFLPFRYMVSFPVEILCGQLGSGDLLVGFAIQSAWLVVALGLSYFVWKRGSRRYAAIGG
jgi:ABC-2 type transport system permease protein